MTAGSGYRQRSSIGSISRFLRLLWHPKSFVRTTGLLRSYRENRPVDATGQPLPWFNYALIRALEGRLNDRMRVFEYGSGYSTLFFARHVAFVTAIEHDPDWAAEVRRQAPQNVEVRYIEAGDDYINAPGEDAEYDLILVDGLDREQCLPHAARALSPAGVIILDDSHRADYIEAIDELCSQGFRTLRFFGPKPNSLVESESVLIYRDHNCLEI